MLCGSTVARMEMVSCCDVMGVYVQWLLSMSHSLSMRDLEGVCDLEGIRTSHTLYVILLHVVARVAHLCEKEDALSSQTSWDCSDTVPYRHIMSYCAGQK